MDVEAFSDDNFNAVEWINSTFKKSENTDKDKFVTSLVTKMQLYVQQVSASVEDISQLFLINLPKVMKDTQSLQSDATLLRQIMSEVEKEIAEVQADTSECMENLERLDSIKLKLKMAKQGLQESDGWGRLTSELDDLLEKNDIPGSCEKLSTLQKSLCAQVGLTGQQERETQVEAFKNRLEAITSPLIVQNFSSGNVEQSKKFVQIFTDMNRLTQLTQYYRQVQKNLLERHWIELTKSSESNRFLRDFYNILLDHYNKQTKWCSQVFGADGLIEPLKLQTEILSSLQPSRETVIMDLLKRSSDKTAILVEMSNANVYLGSMMTKNIDSLSTKPTLGQIKLLSESIFGYFNVFIGQFASIEQTNLCGNLSNLNFSHSTVAETIRALSTSNSKVIGWAEQVFKNCDEVTQNYAFPSTVNTLNVFFKAYLEKFKKAQNQLRVSQPVDQDWSILQTSISLLSCIGDLKRKMLQFESRLCEAILQTYDKLQRQNDHDFGYKVVGKRELNDFKKIVDSINQYKKASLMVQLNGRETVCGIFSVVHETIKTLCVEIHDITLASIFQPIENHLKHIEIVGTSTFNPNASDLPDYSYAPLEYITQVGQYLLTLPQHLEPLLLDPPEQLKVALELCDEKYSRNVPSADILLSLIVDECCAMYQEQIVQICGVSTSEAKQVATDIEYLGNLLEDLGFTLNAHLQQIAALMRSPSENYLSLSAGFDPKLVTAIRQIRNIISKD